MPEINHYKDIDEFINCRYAPNAYSSRAQTRRKYDFAIENKQPGFVISLGNAKIKGRNYHCYWTLYVAINNDMTITTTKSCR